MKLSSFALFLGLCASHFISLFGEVRVLTLRQALDLALAQNPDLLLARLDQQKARDQVTVTHDPFSPKVFAGSGAAWSTGFPNSIEGSAPSIVDGADADGDFQPSAELSGGAGQRGCARGGRRCGAAAGRSDLSRGVAVSWTPSRRRAVWMRRGGRSDNLTRVQELMAQRVAEGRELAIESKKANLAVLRAGQRVDNLAMDLMTAESSLAQALGFGADDRARVAAEERAPLAVPVSEEASIEKALEGSNELKRLESNMQAKMLEIKSYHAERLPKVNLVAQYSLFAKYNYQDYFAKFQRNNAQVGASIEIPLLVGRAAQAQSLQAEAGHRQAADRSGADAGADYCGFADRVSEFEEG